ncbi:TPA: hypothetical protein ENS27_06680 [bacterium]|nr:hypothetical protein [bacterium]
MITLHDRKMYDFLDRFINLALPRVCDFHGVSTKFNGRENYNLSSKEWTIFPEVEYSVSDKVYDLNIIIQTSAKNDGHGFELLKKFGMLFRKA